LYLRDSTRIGQQDCNRSCVPCYITSFFFFYFFFFYFYFFFFYFFFFFFFFFLCLHKSKLTKLKVNETASLFVCTYVCVSLFMYYNTDYRKKKKKKKKKKPKSERPRITPLKTPKAPMLNDVYSLGVWSLCLSPCLLSVNLSLSPSCPSLVSLSLSLTLNVTHGGSVVNKTL
jgi:hypothetical protein